MLTISEEYSNIINSEEFKEWKNKHFEAYLSSAFLDDKGWQFNFYHNNKLITFFIEDSIVKNQESEIYEKKDIPELRLEKIKINLEEAKAIIDKVIEENKEEVTKKIIILQQKENPFWNLTYITNKLNVINLKIDAVSGEILEQKFENVMKFQS